MSLSFWLTMIEISGYDACDEYRAAERMAEFFEELWPGITNTPPEEDHIVIRSGAFLSNQKRKDLDLLIIARLSAGRKFRKKKVIRDSQSNPISAKYIDIRNFVAVGEVKSHSEKRIKVEGGQILVKYKDQPWKSATGQNIEQVHSFLNVCDDHAIKRPFILQFVYLSNISEDIGAAIYPAMPAQKVMSTMVQSGRVSRQRGKYQFMSSPPDNFDRLFQLPVLKLTRPTKLDQKRMERILAGSSTINQILETKPGKLTQISGVGGTGKTVSMLQAAARAYNENGDRSLLLTYNKALVADLQRLMVLLRIKSGDDDGGVNIQTVMSFFYKIAHRCGLKEFSKDDVGYKEYPTILEYILELEQGKSLKLQNFPSESQQDFWFDRVFIDEAQDWKKEECDIIKKLYAQIPLCVADGKQQLVRDTPRTDWFLGIPKDKKRFIPLGVCMRMKSGLCDFVNDLAQRLDMEWGGKRHNSASGGQILVTLDSYDKSLELHARLLKEAKKNNTNHLDWLFLVPANRVRILNDGKKTSIISDFLRENGHDVIDILDPAIRSTFANNPDTFRVLQYDSCRGLEGWILILDKFDIFLENKLSTNESIDFDPTLPVKDYPRDTKELLWNWISIVLSRAMDTIVLTLDNPRSPIGMVLLDQCRASKGIVEIWKNN
jgi:hypothetical protein